MRKIIVLIVIVLSFGSFVRADFPKRIVSGLPSITEMLFVLELDDRIVGVTTNCNYPPEAKKKEKIGRFILNLEKIVSLKPDLVVMLEDAQKKDIKRFKEFGLNVYTINPKSVNDVMNSLKDLGKITGQKKQAQKVVNQMKARLSKVKKQVRAHRPGLAEVLRVWKPKQKGRKALVVVGYDPLIVAGGGTFIDDILKHAGVKNLAYRSRAAYPQYSFEQLVKENPPYIIIAQGLVSEKQLKRDRRWKALDAIKNDQILFIDADIISRPGPRVVEVIEQIAEFIY